MWQIPNAIRKPWLWAVATRGRDCRSPAGPTVSRALVDARPEAHPPAWEVLPQAAKPGEVILSKRNELGICCPNFAATPFTLRGQRYASVEGFWQMMLYPEGPAIARQSPGNRMAALASGGRADDWIRGQGCGPSWHKTRKCGRSSYRPETWFCCPTTSRRPILLHS